MDSSLPGIDLLHALEQSVEQLHAQLNRCREAQDEAHHQLDKLIQEKIETLAELAQHYLPDLSRSSVAGSFSEVRAELREFAQRRARRVEQLRDDLHRLDAQIDELHSAVDQKTMELDQAVQRREQLEKEAAAALDEDETFRELSSRVLTSEQQLARFESRVAEARREADEKLPAYQNSRLFMHLAERNYGTPDYRAGWLAARWDRWIARLIDYPQAKRGYDFLRSMPELMAAEVERHRTALGEAVDKLEAIEMQHWTRLGLDEAIERGQQLGDQRDELVAQLQPLLTRREAVHDELAAATDEDGTYYRQAIDRLREHLDSLADKALSRTAQRTPDETDDRIVADVRWLRDQIDRTREAQQQADDDAKQLTRQVKEMQYVVGRFRQSEFDSGRSRFAADFDLPTHFQRYLEGTINHIELWREIRRGQSFDPTWVEKTSATVGDALTGPTGQAILTATAHVVGHALAVLVQNQLQRRNVFRDRPGGKGLPKMGRMFTRGDGF